jgi:curli biogenesis system outer membrane secretion channel CsgG
MKSLRLLTAVLCIASCSHAFAEVQDIDKELSDLSERLALPIKDHGKTKVAVIDFANLDGSSAGELGKYIAEQLTVDFVMGKRDFSVLDRANLRNILAEHKLTSQGLVDPDNAKKLGQFAGVDALILGTIIPKGTHTVSLTAKIITTDTAEVIGAARAEFKADDTVQQLESKPVTLSFRGKSSRKHTG